MDNDVHYVTEGVKQAEDSSLFTHVHLLSDSTGDTVSMLSRACLSQFEQVNYQEHIWGMVRSDYVLEQVKAGIIDNPGIVLFTIVDPNIRQHLMEFCHQQNLPAFSVMDHFMDIFSNYLGIPSLHQPGRQHRLDAEYFGRIDAMQYSLMHDDGIGDEGMKKADILVTGVSRTSKTPTCIYLANRGMKAANIPLVPLNGGKRFHIPDWVLGLGKHDKPMVVCLVRDADSLVDIRRSRLKIIDPSHDRPAQKPPEYTDIEAVRQEVLHSKRLAARQGWPIIDVTKRSIEEASAIITRYYHDRFQL